MFFLYISNTRILDVLVIPVEKKNIVTNTKVPGTISGAKI
jgi:hypothetical protein